MNFDEVSKKITEIVKEVTHCENDLKLDTKLRRYGVTSLNLIKIVVQIEDYYTIRFRDADVNFVKFDTVEQITNLVIKYRRE